MSREGRVLLLTPTARDAVNSQAILAEVGIASAICRDLVHLCDEIEAGAAVVLVAEEVLVRDETALVEILGRQPPWSDLPILLLTRGGANSPIARRAVATLGNVMLLERPVRMEALVAAVRAAIRARNRQYEVRQRNQELAEASRRKDEFLATLAHELRNPLSPIRTGLQILRMSQIETQDGQTLDMMERQLGHMVHLIDDLMDASRVNSGKVALRLARIDLTSAIESAVETSRQLIESAGHKLEIQLPGEPLLLDADETRLSQVLSNLLNNAAKYTEAGGSIELSAERIGDEAFLRVKDNGVGIPTAMLPKVFDMFTQVGASLERSQGGLGIGLTLVRQLVEMHGGRVEAHSEGAGRGSEFVVRLPLAVPLRSSETSEQLRPTQRERAVESATRDRLLIVDDNRDSANSLARLLRRNGHEVRTAYDGHEALREAEDFAPELILLDIGLPGMNGYEVARRIRQARPHDGVKIIALTGWGQDEDRRRSREAGFDYHLVKPVDPDALASLLLTIKSD